MHLAIIVDEYGGTSGLISLEDIIDSISDINALIDFCKIVPSKVNLIQYNSIGNDDFKAADTKTIKFYEDELEKKKIVVTVRKSRGQDIDAACGQLANKEVSLN